MICDNTISSGFFFMLGKLLFELSIFGGCIVIFVLFWTWVVWSNKPKGKK